MNSGGQYFDQDPETQAGAAKAQTNNLLTCRQAAQPLHFKVMLHKLHYFNINPFAWVNRSFQNSSLVCTNRI